jgi:hypothetical protein
LSAGPIAPIAECPDIAVAAADPVSARKLRRDNADMMAFPKSLFCGQIMRRALARRKRPIAPPHCRPASTC